MSIPLGSPVGSFAEDWWSAPPSAGCDDVVNNLFFDPFKVKTEPVEEHTAEHSEDEAPMPIQLPRLVSSENVELLNAIEEQAAEVESSGGEESSNSSPTPPKDDANGFSPSIQSYPGSKDALLALDLLAMKREHTPVEQTRSGSQESTNSQESMDEEGDSSSSCSRELHTKSRTIGRKRGRNPSVSQEQPTDGLSKRERNKISAANYRKRRKLYMQTLEKKVDQLEDKCSTQTKRVEELSHENELLRAKLDMLKKLCANRLVTTARTVTKPMPSEHKVASPIKSNVFNKSTLLLVVCSLLVMCILTGGSMSMFTSNTDGFSSMRRLHKFPDSSGVRFSLIPGIITAVDGIPQSVQITNENSATSIQMDVDDLVDNSDIVNMSSMLNEVVLNLQNPTPAAAAVTTLPTPAATQTVEHTPAPQQ